MKKLIILLGAGLLLSCASENEQQGLNRIAEIYEAQTSFSKSFNTDEGKAGSSFNVKVSNSAMIDSIQPAVATANIANLIYESMSAEERDSYGKIDVELISTKNDTAGYYYPMEALKKLNYKSVNFKVFTESLLNGNPEKIDEIKNTNDFKNPIGPGIDQLVKKIEAKKGELVGYIPTGISESTNKDGDTAYQYQGYLLFRNGRAPYFVFIESAEGKDEIAGWRIFE